MEIYNKIRKLGKSPVGHIILYKHTEQVKNYILIYHDMH